MKINETYLSPIMNASRPEQKQRAASASAARPSSGRFDTVLISTARRAGENDAATRLREAVSLDVRAAAAAQSERIPALREQIQSGAYQVDPRAIARKLLSMGA